MSQNQTRLPYSHRKIRITEFVFCNSAFMIQLINNKDEYSYPQIKRWFAKHDLFAHHMVFFPVNINNSHWTLAVVFMQIKVIKYYDSLQGPGKYFQEKNLRYLSDKAIETKNCNSTKKTGSYHIQNNVLNSTMHMIVEFLCCLIFFLIAWLASGVHPRWHDNISQKTMFESFQWMFNI